jgi:DNA-binding GntR family transcriptional regulator
VAREKVLRISGGEVVYAELKRQILSLELSPGQRLKESELAEELRVSRTPLREAIKLLLAEDLLEPLPTGGVVVPKLAVRDIGELYTCRAALEAIQATDATRKASEDDLAAMSAIVDRNALLVGFADDAMTLGHSLHELIGKVADNTWVGRLHEQVDGHMTRYRQLTNSTQDRRDQALEEHRAIVTAITTRDPEKAAEVARDHVLAARDQALSVIQLREYIAS